MLLLIRLSKTTRWRRHTRSSRATLRAKTAYAQISSREANSGGKAEPMPGQNYWRKSFREPTATRGVNF